MDGRCAFCDIHGDGHTSTCLVPEVDRLRAELAGSVERLNSVISAGRALSNCAFNLKQDERLPARTRESLKDAQEKWDTVTSGLSTPVREANTTANEPLSGLALKWAMARKRWFDSSAEDESDLGFAMNDAENVFLAALGTKEDGDA